MFGYNQSKFQFFLSLQHEWLQKAVLHKSSLGSLCVDRVFGFPKPKQVLNRISDEIRRKIVKLTLKQWISYFESWQLRQVDCAASERESRFIELRPDLILGHDTGRDLIIVSLRA